jgi:hypothetical protein
MPAQTRTALENLIVAPQQMDGRRRAVDRGFR